LTFVGQDITKIMGKNNVVEFFLVDSRIGYGPLRGKEGHMGGVYIAVRIPSFLDSRYALEFFDYNVVGMTKWGSIGIQKYMFRKIRVLCDNRWQVTTSAGNSNVHNRVLV